MCDCCGDATCGSFDGFGRLASREEFEVDDALLDVTGLEIEDRFKEVFGDNEKPKGFFVRLRISFARAFIDSQLEGWEKRRAELAKVGYPANIGAARALLAEIRQALEWAK